ncbi:MAG: hypothetical protein QNJ63_00885 [Calothrix sp. MO_192.B10]|nr:hypothetical protein [Calothrix sp. MO_192.B10]
MIEILERNVRSAGTKAQDILRPGYLPSWARYIGWGWYWSRFGRMGLKIFESADSEVAFFSHLQKCGI